MLLASLGPNKEERTRYTGPRSNAAFDRCGSVTPTLCFLVFSKFISVSLQGFLRLICHHQSAHHGWLQARRCWAALWNGRGVGQVYTSFYYLTPPPPKSLLFVSVWKVFLMWASEVTWAETKMCIYFQIASDRRVIFFPQMHVINCHKLETSKTLV